ncbi:Putative neutral zinc metallopeptidase [Symmachiella dynata]|uniref:Neutral zinc metallopeptidase n=1 Tax=Symmachiella dynata TaxID=2527995 RepID=A0A517ZI17_9PLAN|nr:zinc metallopeptidase [Symmachiella dynata]QDU42089.1 Putative neutral zinc metallopeptidase [Symmachiella dynata]
MIGFFDPRYLLFAAPAFLLMMWAQARVKSAYHRAMQIPAPLSGAAAARHILDQAGCQSVAIEEVGGQLSDHYDPRAKVLRLSHEVYQSRSMAAVGIAAHEAGHAMQDAQRYAPLVIRNFAVPAAMYGPRAFMVLFIGGLIFSMPGLMWLGVICYGGVLLFQLVNLPVEFDASNRAKAVLADLNIVDRDGALAVKDVLNAAGWTYVAATLQTLMTVLYYVMILMGGRSRD